MGIDPRKDGVRGGISGLLSFLVIVPAVLARGSTIHLGILIAGIVAALFTRSIGLGLLTLLSLAAYFIEGFSIVALWYPVIVSLTLGTVFLLSLFKGPTIIERFAKLEKGSDLTPEIRKYCRKLNIIWVSFFVLNACVAIWTIEWGSKGSWAFYNGVLSYGIAASLFIGERLLRRHFVDESGI